MHFNWVDHLERLTTHRFEVDHKCFYLYINEQIVFGTNFHVQYENGFVLYSILKLSLIARLVRERVASTQKTRPVLVRARNNNISIHMYTKMFIEKYLI